MKDLWTNCKQEIMGIRANTNDDVIAMAYKLLNSVSKAFVEQDVLLKRGVVCDMFDRLFLFMFHQGEF